MIRRRSTQVFSLAFLDCICCGFGAMILVFVLSIGAHDQDKLKTIESLRRILASQLASLSRIKSDQDEANRNNSTAAQRLAEIRLTNDRITSLLDDMDKKIQMEKSGKAALLVDLDDLQKEIAARQKRADPILPNIKPSPLGVPLGSNYIAFVIDTSGSMRDASTGYRLYQSIVRKISDVLDVYPTVKGIQILNSDGGFVFGNSQQDWLPDTPDVRDRIKRTLRTYDQVCESNPVPGIYRVFTKLYRPKDPDMHLGIYVFGDEFTATADAVLKRLDELNPPDADGTRPVVINAVGFPTTIYGDQDFGLDSTGVKFGNLLREVAYRHGGAFIGMQDLY
ncbi:MAG: hypothetical protein RL324_1448 [Verrucomicrobiota bacterium]|jgi:hypothetical protein